MAKSSPSSLTEHTMYSKTSENFIQIVIQIELSRQMPAKCSMLALQNAHMGALCNANMLHLEISCQECLKFNV